MASDSLFRRTWERVKSPAGAAVLAIAGLVSGLATGVWGLLADRQPALQFTVVSVSRVFDIHQPVGGLEISYAGQDLRAAKKVLWSMTVLISNTGSAGIRKGDFDERLPVSIEVKDATIVDKPSIVGSADYLAETFRFAQRASQLVMEPFILDTQDSVRVTLVVLGLEGARPSLAVRGKIAGVKTFDVVTIEAQDASQSVWKRITAADSWWIQPLRAVLYVFVFFGGVALIAVAVAIIVIPIQSISDQRAVARRRAALSKYEFKPLADEALTTANDILLNFYAAHGREGLVRLLRIKYLFATREKLIASLGNSGLPASELILRCPRRSVAST